MERGVSPPLFAISLYSATFDCYTPTLSVPFPHSPLPSPVGGAFTVERPINSFNFESRDTAGKGEGKESTPTETERGKKAGCDGGVYLPPPLVLLLLLLLVAPL